MPEFTCTCIIILVNVHVYNFYGLACAVHGELSVGHILYMYMYDFIYTCIQSLFIILHF